MFHQRAIFFALDALIRRGDSASVSAWSFDPQLPGALRDYSAFGYALVGIFEPSQFAQGEANDTDEAALTASIQQALADAGAPALSAIVVTDDISDPAPFWALRRQLGVTLTTCTLVAEGERYEELAANAGIGRIESPLAALGGTRLLAA